MGACLSCLGRETAEGAEGERQPLVGENSADLDTLGTQLRDAKLLAVLNATNERLIDHDEAGEAGGAAGTSAVQRVKPVPSGVDPVLLRAAIQIKDT